MAAIKQEVHKNMDTRYWITAIGTILLYIVAYALIVINGIRNSPPTVNSEEVDVLQLIWDSLGNAGTLVPLVVSGISGIFLRKFNKDLPIHSIAIISGLGFLLYCFYNISVHCYIHPVIVAIVGLISFVASMSIVLARPSRVVINRGSIIRTAIGEKIKNAKIAGIQIFECTMTEDHDSYNYVLHSMDHLSDDESDINGILSVTYNLKKADINGFEFVTQTSYRTLVESANDDAKENLIKLIEEKIEGIRARLQRINNVSEVSKDDCCLARLMVMYNAYLKMLRPAAGGTTSVPDAYIGEHDLKDGDLGVGVDVEKRLFTLVRTGLLGGILVGPNCIYNFQYRKDGYKVGRQYCIFHINESERVNRNRIFLCLVVLKEGSMKALPPYVLQAIRKMIPMLEDSLHNFMQEGKY